MMINLDLQLLELVQLYLTQIIYQNNLSDLIQLDLENIYLTIHQLQFQLKERLELIHQNQRIIMQL